ncbi:MAG: hypothetical protein A2126_01705 [Candidatus Woykebacteria bacterium GWB1_45_5]|uniref:Aminoglycoside phosphotransferase domain-containing protein n=1 Tax=Candidatus Woykebacteria bacterium GWB1_45_5 TaxID=1802592 RepID=A0A1G1W5X3_9BACT|nr:MAG: hypothetical protein A2126_01705 [Candidatus Woykebacteria bacterium GWB1_45_5]
MIIYSKGTLDRKEDFRLVTTIEEENKKLFVRKKAVNPRAKDFLFGMVENYEKLKKILSPLKLAEAKFDGDSVVFPYIKGKTLSDEFKECYFNGQDEKALEILREFKNILKLLPTVEFETRRYKDFMRIFGNPTEKDGDWTVGCLDLNLDNLIRIGRQLYLIDYEWVFEFPLPKKFLYFRTFFYTFFSIKELLKIRCSKEFPLVQLLPEIFVPKEVYDQEALAVSGLRRFYDYEMNFQSYLSFRKNTAPKLKESVIFQNSQKPDIFLTLQTKNDEIEKLKAELRDIYGSKSWKIATSLRDMKRLFKKTS